MTTTELPAVTGAPRRTDPGLPAPQRMTRTTGRVPRWWRDASVALFWLVLLWVTALWVAGGGVQDLGILSGALTSTGRITGLIASALLLVQVFLMARVPWFEQAWGQDSLARTHRLVGFTSFNLLWAHIVLITLGYAAASPAGSVGHHRRLRPQLPGHAAGRRRHGGAVPRRRHVGEEGPRAGCATSRGTSSTSTATSAPGWPCRTSCGPGRSSSRSTTTDRHLVDPVCRVPRRRPRLPGGAARCGARCGRRCGWSRSTRRRPGSPRSSSAGPGSQRLAVRPGQFLQWRFVDGPGLDAGQPLLALGRARTVDYLRVTAAAVGDGSTRLATLRPGDPGARRGTVRPAARGGAHPAQGAADGRRASASRRCAPCSRDSTRTPVT